jgi:hypothetical protein
MARHTDRSIAFELCEQLEHMISRARRAMFDPQALTPDWLNEQEVAMRVRQSQLKERALKERAERE